MVVVILLHFITTGNFKMVEIAVIMFNLIEVKSNLIAVFENQFIIIFNR